LSAEHRVSRKHILKTLWRSGRLGTVDELREFVILLAFMAIIDAITIEFVLRVMVP
jgi:hypothetical protein